MALAGADKRVVHRRTLARRGPSEEQQVLLPDCVEPDRILDQVVVDPGKGVVLVCDPNLPVIKQVGARLPHQGVLQGLPGEDVHDVAEPTQRPSKLFPPKSGAGLLDSAQR